MASEYATFLSQICIQSYCQSMMKESPIWNAWYFDYNSQKVIGYLGFLSAPHFVTEICLQLDLQITRNNLNRSQRATAEQQKIRFEMHVGVRRILNYMSKVGKTMQNLCPSVLLNWNRRLHISVDCMDVCGYKRSNERAWVVYQIYNLYVAMQTNTIEEVLQTMN